MRFALTVAAEHTRNVVLDMHLKGVESCEELFVYNHFTHAFFQSNVFSAGFLYNKRDYVVNCELLVACAEVDLNSVSENGICKSVDVVV